MENKLSEQDSLNLINQTILQARNTFQKGMGNDFIFAGYCVSIVAIINLILIYTLNNPSNSFWIWLLMIPMQIGFRVIDRRREKKILVKTHISKIVGNMWAAFGFSVLILLISTCGAYYALKLNGIGLIITPVILTMTGLAQYATSVALRFRPYFFGSCVFWGGALLCVAIYFTGHTELQIVILALSMIFGFVVPGHLANKKAIEHV